MRSFDTLLHCLEQASPLPAMPQAQPALSESFPIDIQPWHRTFTRLAVMDAVGEASFKASRGGSTQVVRDEVMYAFNVAMADLIKQTTFAEILGWLQSCVAGDAPEPGTASYPPPNGKQGDCSDRADGHPAADWLDTQSAQPQAPASAEEDGGAGQGNAQFGQGSTLPQLPQDGSPKLKPDGVKENASHQAALQQESEVEPSWSGPREASDQHALYGSSPDSRAAESWLENGASTVQKPGRVLVPSIAPGTTATRHESALAVEDGTALIVQQLQDAMAGFAAAAGAAATAQASTVTEGKSR